MSKWNKESFYEAIIDIPWSGCWVSMMGCRKTPSPNYLQPWMLFEGKSQSSARVAWKLFKGEIPTGAYILHTCDNCYCVNPAHLYLGDHAINMRDMNVRGRANGGHGALGLTHLEEARKMRTEGFTNQQIGDRFGFHHKSISRALNGGRYKES